METDQIRGRRVLVTGASGALGGATVAALRARGATVVGLDQKPADGVISCDVTDSEQVKEAVARGIEQLGGLDTLITFAGVGEPVDIGAAPDEGVLRTLNINLLGNWRTVAAALPALLATRGRVVLISSGLAYLTVPFAGAYAVSKRALTAYADTLRAEYGTRIGVTTIYPGYVDTPIHEASRAVNVALDGTVPPEKVRHVVHTVLRALSGRRTPRDRATTLVGAAGIWAARYLPAPTDRVVARHMRRLVRRGKFADAPLAAGLLQRLGAASPHRVRRSDGTASAPEVNAP